MPTFVPFALCTIRRILTSRKCPVGTYNNTLDGKRTVRIAMICILRSHANNDKTKKTKTTLLYLSSPAPSHATTLDIPTHRQITAPPRQHPCFPYALSHIFEFSGEQRLCSPQAPSVRANAPAAMGSERILRRTREGRKRKAKPTDQSDSLPFLLPPSLFRNDTVGYVLTSGVEQISSARRSRCPDTYASCLWE
jgi:hypothetical protein